MKLKVPDFLTRRPAFLKPKPAKPRPQQQKLRAATAARRMSPAMDDDMDDEPTTRLSSAFFVVLILHIVAVGGIYAFNSIKAHRRGDEAAASTAQQAAPEPAAPKTQPPPAPEPAAPTEATLQPALAAQAPAALTSAAAVRFYTVKAGDNLTKIANTLGVTVAELQMVNSPKETAILRPGQILSVPVKKPSERAVAAETAAANTTAKKTEETTAKSGGTRTHSVQKGETATSIARRYGVTVDDLLKLNKVSDPKKLQLGQSLKLPPKKVN